MRACVLAQGRARARVRARVRALVRARVRARVLALVRAHGRGTCRRAKARVHLRRSACRAERAVVLPLRSSAASGFFFCGISEEPAYTRQSIFR
eukprot:3355569-Pleurochrysis_carterae.AAC.1